MTLHTPTALAAMIEAIPDDDPRLALLFDRRAAIVVDGDSGDIIFANGAAAMLLGNGRLADLMGHGAGPEGPGMDRLRSLATDTARLSGERVEMLRFEDPRKGQPGHSGRMISQAFACSAMNLAGYLDDTAEARAEPRADRAEIDNGASGAHPGNAKKDIRGVLAVSVRPVRETGNVTRQASLMFEDAASPVIVEDANGRDVYLNAAAQGNTDTSRMNAVTRTAGSHQIRFLHERTLEKLVDERSSEGQEGVLSPRHISGALESETAPSSATIAQNEAALDQTSDQGRAESGGFLRALAGAIGLGGAAAAATTAKADAEITGQDTTGRTIEPQDERPERIAAGSDLNANAQPTPMAAGLRNAVAEEASGHPEMAGRSATLETVDHTQDDETPVSDHPAIGTRFRFALNPQAEVAETMPELSDIGLAGAVGADMDTLIAGDPTPLANAIEARDTFNRVLIQWHTNDGGAPVNVLLSGLPLLDGEGGFYGLRAFGVIGARSGQSASNVSGSDEPTDADATKIAESGSAENAGLAPELSAAPAAETMVEATEPLDDQSTEQAALFDSEPSDPSGLSETADAADTGGIGDLASDATAEKHAHPAEDQGVSVDEALDNGVPDTASNRLKRLAAVGAGLAAAGTAAGLARGDDNAPQTSQPNTGEEEPTLLTAADIPARRPMRPTEETLRASNGLARSDQAALDEIAERLGNGHAPVPVPVEDEPAPEMDPEMVTATGQDAADDIAGDPSPDPEQASQDAIGDSASSLEAAVPGSDGEPDSASDAPELRAEDGRVDDLLADKDEIESPGSDDPSDIGTDTRAGVPGDDEVPGRDDDRTEGVLLPFSRQRGETGSFADRIDVAREVANETGRDGGRKTGGARDWATIASAATALGGLGAGLGVMSGAGAQDSEDATEISDPEADQTADEAIDKASGADATPDVDRPDAQGNHLIELVDRLPLGMLFVRDENPLYANRAFLDLFGYADVDDLSHSGGMQALFENLSDTNKSGKRMLTGVTSDNRPFQVEARLQMARWIDGPALLLSIRERDQFDTAPLETADAENATLRDVLDTVPDAVIVTDLEGRIESANAPARSMLGPLDRSEMRPTLPALFAEDGQRALALAIETLSDFSRAEHDGDFRDPEPISATLIARDGNRIEAEVTLSSVGIGAREKICAVIRRIQVAGQDTSSAAESGAIAGANVLTGSDKSDVLAKVSHEIRTPVNAIIGFADMMLDEQYGPIGHERYAGYLKDIKTSGLHIVSLVNDLLDLSKVEAGMLDLDFAETALNDVVEQCTAIMQSQASRESVILRASLAQSLPPVVADVRSIRQILLNLLSNAIKFTPTGGQVIVSTVYADNGAVELRVRDTGVGMTEADIAQALEPYRQNTTTGPAHPNRGSGIGLPLTKALAEANRTQFSLNSVPGEGTTVHVIFPPTRVLAE